MTSEHHSIMRNPFHVDDKSTKQCFPSGERTEIKRFFLKMTHNGEQKRINIARVTAVIEKEQWATFVRTRYKELVRFENSIIENPIVPLMF